MCWNWQAIGDVIKAIAPVFTAGAACAGACIAYLGLTKWRAEVLGKRRADLAEEVLSGFLQMRGIIQEARAPMAFGGEANERPTWEGETPAQADARRTYFVPVARLLRHSEFISNLEAKRYRMNAFFGATAEAPFDLLFGVVKKIQLAARMMMRSIAIDGSRQGPDNLWARWESTIWFGMEDPDPFATEVENAITAIEGFCRPILTGKKS
jgi:hypothetical protein